MNKDTQKNSRTFSYGHAIIWTAFILTSIGLIAIYAASSMKGAQQFNDPFFFLRKQSLVALLGFMVIYGIKFVPFKWIEKITLPALLVSTILLSFVFIPGAFVKVGGASRWLHIGGLRFQPSELAKMALVFFLAKNLSRPKCNAQNLGMGLFSNLAIFAVLAALLMAQPDFGSTMLLAGLTFIMLYAAGLSKKLIASGVIVGLLSVIAAVIVAPYRMKRLVSFLDPWAQLQSGGFQIIQSYLGFQNGGLLGVGLGESKQKLFFLPEAHTDFILSVIGEEMGLLGVLLVCALYVYMIWLGFKITSLQKTSYRKFLAYGFTCLIAMQSAFNMGVVMGLLPTKGITLPFISSGASSLIVFLTVIAILAKLGSVESEPTNV